MASTGTSESDAGRVMPVSAYVGRVTHILLLPETIPNVAVMATPFPAVKPLARPVLFTVTAVGVSEVQVTDEVMSWVELSEYVPVAVYCQVDPVFMLT